MIEKIEKLENFLNKIIGKLLSSIGVFLLKIIHFIIPAIVFRKITETKLSSKKKLTSSKDFLKNNILNQYQNFNKAKDSGFDKIESLQKYPFKEKGIEKLGIAKTFILTTPPKQHYLSLKNFFIQTFNRIKSWFKQLDHQQLKVGTSVAFFIFIGGYGIYYSIQEVYKSEFPYREPASVQEYDYKPGYKVYAEKTLQVLNIKLPIFVESIGKVDSITIDFSVRTSTRFAKYYLVEYEYKLKDYFFTTVEPVVSDFPMETEGKEVLKEKIREEIDNFLYENYVEGHVEEVNILYMVGS
jgi:hypothetical protein